jgi:hypothetical protein
MPLPFQRGKTGSRSLNAALLNIFTVATLPPASQVPGAFLYCSDAANTAASLTTALTGNNNDMKFTAKAPGTGGNSITVAYVDPSANDATLSVSVTGSAITVNLATSSEGAITSTAAQIKAAIEASAAANALVAVAHHTGNDGSGVVIALAATNLTGGANLAAPVVSDGTNWKNINALGNTAGAGLGI